MPGSGAWCRTARHLNDEELQAVADGRVFTGHQGIGLKLVDELGDEQTGIAWLAKEKNINAKLPVRDYRAARPRSATCRSCTRPLLRRWMPPGLGARWPAASTTGARCRRWSGSILTVCWRFGTLPEAE